jgi:hypothetical protein
MLGTHLLASATPFWRSHILPPSENEVVVGIDHQQRSDLFFICQICHARVWFLSFR